MKFKRLEQVKRAHVEEWAGSVIYKRGADYHRSGRVEKPAITADGALIAWVSGSEKYATLVELEGGALRSLCTCPYDGLPPCKHAVALLLAYLEAQEKNRPIPAAKPSDERIAIIDNLLLMDDRDDWEEDEAERPARASGGHGKNRNDNKEISRFLAGLGQEALIELIREWSGRFPEMADDLAHRIRLAKGDTGALTAAIRHEILETTAQDAWYDHWQNEGELPDYSRLKRRLGDLLNTGAADDVVQLGTLLLERGGRQVETSNDEGETASEIADCMEVVFQALSRTTMPEKDRMLWAIDADLKDSYDLCEGAERFWRQPHAASDWSIVADHLLKRLQYLKPPAGKGDFSTNYDRDRLTNWIIRALENAGRNGEIIPLCEAEAEKTESYTRLVQRLLDEGRVEDAERWCRLGIRALKADHSGITRWLRTTLREISEKRGDWLVAAAFRAEDFLDCPSREAFEALEKASRQAKVHPQVRSAALDYLETGRLPTGNEGWPLQETGTAEKPIRPGRYRQFPLVSTLIDIAIAEKKPAEALRWYDFQKASKPRDHIYDEDRLADAIAKHDPERAAILWKELAEAQIALTKPTAYREAMTYLRKMQKVLDGKDEAVRFNGYIRELRGIHIRKKRLIEMLNELS